NHKGGLARGQVVGGAHPGEDAVHNANLRHGGGDKAANLGHDGDDGSLPHVRGLARHVVAGDDGHPVVVHIHVHVVGDKGCVVEQSLHHGVAAVLEVELAAHV